jgi:V/A-type H+-transporting ATPase subunit C
MDYPYANGQIKAIENNILDRSQYLKLMKTEKDQFLKTLVDMGYSTYSDQLEEMINRELKRTKQYLDEISPEKRYTDLFFFASDALNIKVFYKMKVFGITHFDIYQDTGTLPKDDLKKAILEGDFTGFSKDYQALFSKINDRIKDETNPRIVSARIDDAIYGFIMERLRFSQAKALKTYFESSADFSNLLTLVRSRRLNWEYGEFTEMFLHQGIIPISVFASAYQASPEAMIRLFRDYYNEKLSQGLKQYSETKDLGRLERHFDKLTLELMKEYRHDSFGIGPIIYYYLKKQAEAKNLRLLYSDYETDIIDLLE